MKTKILFLVNVDWFFISHRLPIAVAAKRAGFEVHIACAFTGHQGYLSSLGFLLHDIPFSRSGKWIGREFSTLYNLYKLLNFIKPDLLHAITIKPVLYGGITAKLAGIKRVVYAVSGLGLVFVSEGYKAKAQRFLVTMLYKVAFRVNYLKVIFQNPVDKRILTDALGLLEEQCVMIRGSGADLAEYSMSPEPCGNPVIIMAARLLREKGVYDFVEAARNLKVKGMRARFLLVGEPDPGNPNTVTQNELDIWREEGIVELLGFRSDIANLFSMANLIVLPSFYGEGLPKVLIEAAACGRAIVTTDNPGCAEAVIDGETGLIVPTRNVNALAAAIERLICDAELRRHMGKQARQLAEREFDINSVVKKHLEIYQELLSNDKER